MGRGTWGVMQRPRETPACSQATDSPHTAHLRAVKAESSRAQAQTPAGIHRKTLLPSQETDHCPAPEGLTTGVPGMQQWKVGPVVSGPFHLKIP